MSRIYEALEFAGLAPTEDAGSEVEFKITLPPASTAFEEKLIALYSRVEVLLASPAGKVISITGISGSESAGTYVLEMARTAASRLGKRVLVLATNESACAAKLREGGLAKGWEGITYSARSINEVVFRISDPAISVSLLNATKEGLPALIASSRFLNTLRLLRKRYDWILVDTPPLGTAMEATLVAPIVDGTLVVADAGKVRWQVLRHAVEQIASQRGNVLGVALNKRRHIIPDFIYRKL